MTDHDRKHHEGQGHDKAMDDELAMRLAEETDLSPNQALELIEKHGRDYETLRRIAASYKAEG